MPTKAELKEIAKLEAIMAELQAQNDEVDRQMAMSDAFPRDWQNLHKTAPTRPKKCKLTVSLDADMVAWYRALGRGYQRHLNGVLRSYMQATLARAFEQHPN